MTRWGYRGRILDLNPPPPPGVLTEWGETMIKTRQSMFVKHVPPLWAYFKEATKL